ncbi:MAG: GGDEF domain-containing protein, partial [Spirochaetaceae bacterium]|nr:GGDEF domain-containing protein [Spirochaetaceae bacterium]
MTLFSLLVINSINTSKKITLTKLTKTQAKLRILATTDPLTGLFNRRFFIERAESEISRSKRRNTPLAVMMADLDDFKKINDSLGHIFGDQVLIKVSRIIKDSLRDMDISGRYGGEEFVMLLPETDQKKSESAAERIRKTISETDFVVNE